MSRLNCSVAKRLGIVGESGCGKSTVAWSIVNFLGNNGYVKRGSIKFMGQELVGKKGEELRQLRGDQIAMVYQDPMQALNPSMRLGEQMKEVLTVHRNLSDAEAEKRCLEMLDRVYMPDPASVMKRYPHQISGGQQQRVVIAMALLNNPALLIMDEPTTALDVTVEAAVLDLVADLRRDFDTAIMFISHNLGVVARVCNQVGVMYAGEMVERARGQRALQAPATPLHARSSACTAQTGRRQSQQCALSDPWSGAAAQCTPGWLYLCPALRLSPGSLHTRTPGIAPAQPQHFGALPLCRRDRPGGVDAAGGTGCGE